jgi:hypothetical protein
MGSIVARRPQNNILSANNHMSYGTRHHDIEVHAQLVVANAAA